MSHKSSFIIIDNVMFLSDLYEYRVNVMFLLDLYDYIYNVRFCPTCMNCQTCMVCKNEAI